MTKGNGCSHAIICSSNYQASEKKKKDLSPPNVTCAKSEGILNRKCHRTGWQTGILMSIVEGLERVSTGSSIGSESGQSVTGKPKQEISGPKRRVYHTIKGWSVYLSLAFISLRGRMGERKQQPRQEGPCLSPFY